MGALPLPPIMHLPESGVAIRLAGKGGGQMIKSICSMLVAVAVLTGCNPAKDVAVEACESFAKSRLRSPSTYKQISVDYSGVTFESDGRKVKMVNVEYDAANAYGTPIRGEQMCLFEVDNKGNYADDPAHAANMSAIGAQEYTPCCLLDKEDKISGKSADDIVNQAEAAADAAELAASEAMKAIDASADEGER